MPAGDSQRAWFPEMLIQLKSFWVEAPGWSEVITFCERMTAFRADIREQRSIRSPMMTCRSCGKKHAMTLPPISPRSLLFALQKIEAIGEDELKRLDKDWMRFRKTENLDVLGHRKADDKTSTSACH